MDFKSTQTKVDGVLVTDKNGLILASNRFDRIDESIDADLSSEQGVENDCSGSITLLSDLASTLLQKDAIVCLEDEDK